MVGRRNRRYRAGLAIGWALFVPTADRLAHHDVGATKGALHETAVDNARGRLLTLGAGLFAAGALVFTARNFTVSRRTLHLTEQGQVTDRYTKAIEQLGSDKLDVRIGGIYALERIAGDSARDHPVVMEVLTAFIRQHSHERWPPSDSNGQERIRSTRPDVQAVLTVIRRRDTKQDIRPIDLNGANLYRTRLVDADLGGAILTDADLTGADLTGARLTGADLTLARLPGADLPGANLTGADLTWADLTTTDLSDADLTGADLTEARLTEAILAGANLDDADFSGAELAEADLTGAKWPRDMPVPEGWKLDISSGRLEAAGTDSLTAEVN